jgi:hypothetical protein
VSEPAAAVKNAADRGQVKHADRRDKDKAQNVLNAWRELVKLPAGRVVLWDILCHCKVFESIWHPSALIHANAGRQDVGHWAMAQIANADPQAIFKMMQEAQVADARDLVASQSVQQTKKDDAT